MLDGVSGKKKHLCHSCTGSRLCSPHHPGNSLVMRFAKKTAVDSPLQVTPLFCPFNLSHLQQNQPLASENLASISWDYNHLFQATQFVILCSSSSCWLTEYQEWEVCMLKGESQKSCDLIWTQCPFGGVCRGRDVAWDAGSGQDLK